MLVAKTPLSQHLCAAMLRTNKANLEGLGRLGVFLLEHGEALSLESGQARRQPA